MMNLFEATKKKHENLEKLYNVLLTLKPTSVELQRAFSTKSSQVYFIATFKMRKRKQRKTIKSPSQLYLYSITLNYNNKRNFR